MPYPIINKQEAPVNYSSSQDENEIDLGESIATLIDGKWIVVLAVLATLFWVLLRLILRNRYSAPMYCCKSMRNQNHCQGWKQYPIC